MMSPSSNAALVRARWLAELAVALDEAHRLTVLLSEVGARSSEAVALRSRIIALRSEVESLRGGRHLARNKLDSVWTEIDRWMAGLR